MPSTLETTRTDLPGPKTPAPERPAMHLAVVAHPLHTGGGAVVGRNLLAAIGRQAPQIRLTATIPPQAGYEPILAGLDQARAVPVHRVRPYRQGLQWRRLGRQIAAAGPDVVLSLANFPLPGLAIPQAVLVHNAHLVYPADHAPSPHRLTRWACRLRRAWFRRAIPRTDLVLCQTETMARRLRQAVPDAPPVAVCPNAVSDRAQSGEVEMPAVFRALAGRTVLLALAHPFVHKNLSRLLDALAARRDELADVTVLLTVHPEKPAGRRLLDKARRLGLGRGVCNVGPLSQDQLRAYYRHADAVILPTLLESFSGTYVEAMQFGCPILTSDLDFAREVCGPAAWYFDPWQVDSIAAAICRFREDPALGERLKQAGRQQAARLVRGWDGTASDLLDRLIALVKTSAGRA
jgi:glycosyltransferase involved in cell wall biosynthesis